MTTQEITHNPGPWESRATFLDGEFFIHDSKGAMVASTTRALPGAQAQVNAALIAAAPELLNLCKVIAEHFFTDRDCSCGESSDVCTCTVNVLRRAIAKAEGRI